MSLSSCFFSTDAIISRIFFNYSAQFTRTAAFSNSLKLYFTRIHSLPHHKNSIYAHFHYVLHVQINVIIPYNYYVSLHKLPKLCVHNLSWILFTKFFCSEYYLILRRFLILHLEFQTFCLTLMILFFVNCTAEGYGIYCFRENLSKVACIFHYFVTHELPLYWSVFVLFFFKISYGLSS